MRSLDFGPRRAFARDDIFCHFERLAPGEESRNLTASLLINRGTLD